jgi:hypothetical protein
MSRDQEKPRAPQVRLLSDGTYQVWWQGEWQDAEVHFQPELLDDEIYTEYEQNTSFTSD